ncbi:reverse transcriptase domain-containing protein [Tanacetum coccineum]|uniref:Reverse transcriptase domain-containing protein n=1 Tax=Tanacetum coccineum TaxID=301880 RepID=A0ABQ5ICS8_9ASTR
MVPPPLTITDSVERHLGPGPDSCASKNRPGIRKIRAVPSTAHGMLKFPVEGGTVTLQSSKVIPMECAMISGPSIQSPAVNQAREEKINIAIHPEYPEQTVAIGSTLTEKRRKELCKRKEDRHRKEIRFWGRNLEVYVDDHGYKEATRKKQIIRRQNSKYSKPFTDKHEKNPKKCTFGMQEGMFLGYKSDFQWTPEAEEAFKQMKKLIAELPTLIAPREHEELIIYLAAAKEAISAVLMTDREGRQIPVLRYEDWTGAVADINEDGFYGSGAGLILTNPEGTKFTYAMRFGFEATNNEAEYEALIASLRIAEQMGVKNLQANVDSKIGAIKVNGSYIAKESGHKRRQNDDTHMCVLTQESSEDKKKARAVRRKAARYAMINGTLYKKSFLGPWLRCVRLLQANYVLREIHEGSCSMHSGPRSVVAKVIRTGYYWPTMHMDARKLIRECNDCQIHRPVPRNLQQNLTPITSPWPFYKWGIDIAGPFPEGPGKVKFLIVAIDYFTKWIEAKAVATITGNQVKKFVWDNIVCRFGLPGEIISENGKQFRDNPFKDWCEKLCIRQCFASVKHPQANGLVERANRSLGEGIKARLDERSKDWIEELPHVL